ncbi:MAG: LA2681 family HEPN domain-containing protein [Methanocellales archaeon]|nr:LA2681 family HEPN domain-containing protein [Methanocellales archaeon]
MEHKMAQEICAISELINEEKYQKALDRFLDLEAKNPKNKTIKFNRLGLLIDIGFGLKNSEIVKEGLAAGEKLLIDLSYKDYKVDLYYNLANGYMSLYQLEYDREKSVEYLVDNENLQNAKRNFRDAIMETNHSDSKLRSQLWTNYGNCLDSLGRGVEAFYAYDEALKINPSFPMALGNKAKAMRFFADISGTYREAMYIKSYQMLKSALENKDFIKFGSIAAKMSFEDEIQRIEKQFKYKSPLSKNLEHPYYDLSHATSFERFYIDFCSKHKLFLNFHIHEGKCEASILDPIFISLITPIDDDETFYNLAKYINQIKEDYATARLLLVQSQFKRGDFDNISERTTFVNTLDYSIFNIYIGLLKTAFKEAYNILDKIVVFINEYYNIGLEEGHVYFYSDDDKRCIWQEKKKIREKILHSENISLYALYDIFQDFNSNYYKKFKDIRNALVHRKLIVYDSVLTNWGEEDNILNIGYETMLSQTIELLQLVKSSIIYLINFVQLEETKKKKDSIC